MYAEKRITTITDVLEAAEKRKMERLLFVQQCGMKTGHVENDKYQSTSLRDPILPNTI